MLYKQFYSELGKLLYAVADADGIISKEERKELLDIVRKDLVPSEKNKDDFGTDAAYYTEFEFEIMDDAIQDADIAFESFTRYIEDHRTAIDNKMVNAARKATARLAEAYYHKNKKEKQLLKELNEKLDSLRDEKK